MFNNIVLQNTSSTGAVTKRIRVPLAYAPKEKFLVRLEQQANLQEDRAVSITLPRLGFEITGLSYDSSRKLNKMNKTIRVKSNEEGKDDRWDSHIAEIPALFHLKISFSHEKVRPIAAPYHSYI